MYCHNCGAQIPDGAKFCTECGAKTSTEATNNSTPDPSRVSQASQQQTIYHYNTDLRPKKKKSKWWIWVIVGIIVLSAFGRGTSSTNSSTKTSTPQLSESEYRAQCVDVSYDAVARNPDNYKGKYIKFTGEVVQVVEGYSNTFRISQDDPDSYFSSDYWYVTYKPGQNESRILEGDHITVYAECTGTTSYRSVFGGKITIPSARMMYYDILTD